MNVLTKPRVSVDEFLDWAIGRPGRWELLAGEIVRMSPETIDHAEIKGTVYIALKNAVRRARIPCRALTDGMIVRIDGETAYEPDAQVYCGERLQGSAREVPNPVIIVEVLSPSTQRIDMSRKLADYFRLPSVAHYLIVDPTQPSIVHHTRGTGETILTRVVTEGQIVLDPPGLEISVGEIYAAD
jgi:Uma2 family endonuclease